MRQVELERGVAKQLGIPQTQVKQVADAMLDKIVDELKRGGSVNLYGFGTFKVSEHEGYTFHNPRTNEDYQVPTLMRPYFTPSDKLKKMIREAF